MRAYSSSTEEDLLSRDLLRDWLNEGLLADAQYRRMEQDTVCQIRRTNIFLRVVLFLFTLVVSGAAAGLFFATFLRGSVPAVTGAFLLTFAAVSYAAAELAVSRGQLYRYGIEEALAVCSVGFLCAGVAAILFSPQRPGGPQFLVPLAGVIASLWIWHRFGLWYACAASLIFAAALPGYATATAWAQHAMVAAIYMTGLIAVAGARSRNRLAYLDHRYSIFEALLWLGMCLAINIQISSPELIGHWWAGGPAHQKYPSVFYWTTWILTWCLPPAMLWRGIKGKDRIVIAAGSAAAILTLITNKPYLGWPRQTWDPMLLGALLAGIAVFLHRWLSAGPNEIRNGFTARRLSKRDEHRMNAGSLAFGLALPHSAISGEQTSSPEVRFGGGDSAGGGATSDF